MTVPDGRLSELPARELAGGLRLVEATTRRSRMRGLAHLDSMPHAIGLDIPRCRSVHTIGMRFDLDLIWLDRVGHVVRIDRDVPARRMRTCVRASRVVEVNAGTADAFVSAGLGEPFPA